MLLQAHSGMVLRQERRSPDQKSPAHWLAHPAAGREFQATDSDSSELPEVEALVEPPSVPSIFLVSANPSGSVSLVVSAKLESAEWEVREAALVVDSQVYPNDRQLRC